MVGYWIYQIIKLLFFVALAVFCLKKVVNGIKNKTLTWDSVRAFYMDFRDMLRKMKSDIEQEREAAADQVQNEYTQENLTTEEEIILCTGKNYDLQMIYLILFGLLSVCFFFLGILWEDLGMSLLMVFFTGIILFFLYFLENLLLSLRSFVVTNKRIYYRWIYRQVDLPLDYVTAVGTNLFLMITVSTPSGVIRLPWIENYRKIHRCIVDLLLARQNKTNTVIVQMPTAPDSPTEEKPTAASADTTEPEEPAPPTVQANEPEAQKSDEDLEESIQPDLTVFPTESLDSTTSSGVKVIRRKPVSEDTDPFAPSVKYVPAKSLEARGMRIGRCDICRRIELPVKMVPVMVSGVKRQRTLCEKCAEKHAVKEETSGSL